MRLVQRRLSERNCLPRLDEMFRMSSLNERREKIKVIGGGHLLFKSDAVTKNLSSTIIALLPISLFKLARLSGTRR
jgi:hypothetical protein